MRSRRKRTQQSSPPCQEATRAARRASGDAGALGRQGDDAANELGDQAVHHQSEHSLAAGKEIDDFVGRAEPPTSPVLKGEEDGKPGVQRGHQRRGRISSTSRPRNGTGHANPSVLPRGESQSCP